MFEQMSKKVFDAAGTLFCCGFCDDCCEKQLLRTHEARTSDNQALN